jgi:hypothetical protein
MRLRYVATAAFFLGLGLVSHAVIAATILPQQTLLLQAPGTATCIAGFTPSSKNFDAKVNTSYTCRSAVLACAKGTVGQKVTSSQSTLIYKCGVPSTTSTSDDWTTPTQ